MLTDVQEMKYCVWEECKGGARCAHLTLCCYKSTCISLQQLQTCIENQSNTHITRDTAALEFLGNYYSMEPNALGLYVLMMVLKGLYALSF